MTPSELEAYHVAKALLKQASEEAWTYVSLSPNFQGTSQPRVGLEILSQLTTLPPEIGDLPNCTILELRATQLSDLAPLHALSGLAVVHLEGIPACQHDEDLSKIASTADDAERIQLFKAWLDQHQPQKPPEIITDGPQFFIPETGQIQLIDANLSLSDDKDQKELLDECRRKSQELAEISEAATNVSPSFPAAIDRYISYINRAPSEIGARTIWSVANTLETTLEIHKLAILKDRQSDEMPPRIAAGLEDLLQTHRIWFLGHPDARKLEERVRKHERQLSPEDRRRAAAAVV